VGGDSDRDEYDRDETQKGKPQAGQGGRGVASAGKLAPLLVFVQPMQRELPHMKYASRRLLLSVAD
jgi:hypothetical protein